MQNIKFMDEYKTKITEYRQKHAETKKDIAELHRTKEELERKYSVYIGKMDFDGASKLKRKAKDTEAELETKEDILKVLEEKIKNGDEEQAIKTAKGYLAFKKEQAEKAADLIEQASEKRREYLKALQELDFYNSDIMAAARELRKLEKATNWNNPQVIREVGFHLLSENGSDAEIKMSDYFINNMSDIRSFY